MKQEEYNQLYNLLLKHKNELVNELKNGEGLTSVYLRYVEIEVEAIDTVLHQIKYLGEES
jgi:hypothetical protein